MGQNGTMGGNAGQCGTREGHDDATLNFISDSSNCMLGLSNEISFVSVFFLEGGQNSQNVKLKNCLCRSICPPVYICILPIDTAKFKQDRFSVNHQFLERIIILNPFQ